MRKTLCLVAALVTGLLINCSEQKNPTGQENSYPNFRLEDDWIAVSIRGLDVTSEQLTFEIDSTAELFAHGFCSCNQFMSTVNLDADGLIEFGQIWRTNMYCPAFLATEQIYLGALKATRRYRITRSRLEFFDDAGVRLVMFARQAS